MSVIPDTYPTPTYQEAMDRLEQIVAELEGDRVDVDQMLALTKEAERLISFCRGRLKGVSTSLEDMLKRMKEE